MCPISGYRNGRPMRDPPTGVACNPLDLYPLEPGPQLEMLAVFAACVPGNSAAQVWPKVRKMIGGWKAGPFDWLRHHGSVGRDLRLREAKIGRYEQVGARLSALAQLDDRWRPSDLLGLTGFSFKTIRMMELYTWPGGKCACLDRHVLRPMKSWPLALKLGLKVPDSSPQDGDVYAVLETLFLREAGRLNLAPWELDRELWKAGAGVADG